MVTHRHGSSLTGATLPHLLLFSCLISFSFSAQAEKSESSDSYDYLGEFSIGYKYQEMEAETIRYAYVKTVGLNIVQFIWNPGEASWARDRGWLSSILPSISYEETPGNSAEQDKIAEVSETSKQGWKRFVGTFDVTPETMLTDAEESAHHIDIRLDVQTFLVTVQTTQDYFYVDDNDARLLTAGDQLDVNSVFTEGQLGYRFEVVDQQDYNGLYSAGLGIFSVDYEKPISSDISSPIESIYKGSFSATGMYLQLGFKAGDLKIDARYDYAPEAKATVEDGISLSRSEFGYDESIEYSAYRLGLTYDLQNFLFGLPLTSQLNYVQRQFTTFVDGDKLNEDRIIDLSFTYKFML